MNAKRFTYIFVSLLTGMLFVAVLFLFLTVQSTNARAETLTPVVAIRYVSTTGNDTSNDCTNTNTPFRTVQRAMTIAQEGDDIRVATGTYTGTMFAPNISMGVTATVVISKDIASLLGGYSPDFTTRDPALYPSILNASDTPHGHVVVISSTNTLLDGFTLTGGTGACVGDCSVLVYLGGAIRVRGGSPTISNNRIQGNFGYGGGGIAVTGKAASTITANTIYSNTTDGLGGGIFISSGSAIITGNMINSNVANIGGGIYVGYAEVTITNNLIAYNVGQDPSGGGGGGGIWICCNSQGSIRENELLHNIATEGGAIVAKWDVVSVSIQQNTMAYNQTSGPGGAIRVGDSGVVNISYNDVYSNVAGWEGSICVADIVEPATIVIDGNYVHNNQIMGGIDWLAGGIYLGENAVPVTLTNNVIVENHNQGIKTLNANSFIINNSIVGNGVGVETFTWPVTQTVPYTTTLYNNIIASNQGCGFTAWNGINLVSDFNDVWDNVPNYCAPASPGQNDISVDPLFVNPVEGDYHIQFGSPAMNAGTNQGAPPFDKDGTPRPQLGIVDMGAYEIIGFQIFLPLLLR